MVKGSKETFLVDPMLVSLPTGDIAGSVNKMKEMPAHIRGY